MSLRNKAFGFLLVCALLVPSVSTPIATQARPLSDPPQPLPRDCGEATWPSGAPGCCIFGYVYHDDAPVTGASVHIASPYGFLDTTTTSGPLSSHPYYQADLSSSPLLAFAGEVITITASYDGMVSHRTWTVQDSGQHVDLGLVAGCQALALSASADSVSKPTAPTTRQVEQSFGQLPLYFVENRGQIDGRVAYYIQGRDKSIYFAPEGVTFALTKRTSATGYKSPIADEREPQAEAERWTVKMDFVDANPNVRPIGQDKTEAVVSYFKGAQDQWLAGLPTYARIVYQDLWPGIDLVYYGTVNELKYEFIVHPGADPAQIRLAYRGATDVSLNPVGQLQVTTPVGGFQDDAPVAYQDSGGERTPVAVAYAFQESDQDHSALSALYSFQIGSYDPSRLLVIDPVMLVYCGYIGGSGDDLASGIAVDGAGNAYISGITWSSAATFPVTVGPDLSYNGVSDGFVAKLNATGTALLYVGYIGGTDDDAVYAITVDGSGNAYIGGYTKSDQSSFPVTVGPDLTFNGATDAYVAKVNAAGTALIYAGYVGGSGSEEDVRGIVVDATGNAYIVGHTPSSEASFPVTVGPDLTYNGGTYDGYVAKVNAAGTALVYAGYIGGSGEDVCTAIDIDDAGNAYVTGDTMSSEATFPVTVGPDLTYNGGRDAYVAKVNAAGAALIYAGYIGGTDVNIGLSIATDGAGNAYIAGQGLSSEASFPVAVGPDLTHNGGYDAIVAKVNPAGTTLVYAGYIGGSGSDYCNSIAVDDAGNAYVAGDTTSTEVSFPVTGGPDLSHNGGQDVYVAEINAAGTALVFAGYVGGTGTDRGPRIALDDAASNAYIVGSTGSTEASFPVTVGPDLTYNGSTWDVFVARLAVSESVYSITGCLRDGDSDPISDVTISAGAGVSTTTGATGCYTITGLVPDTYTLTPTKNGWTFVPVTRTVSVPPDATGQDFAGYVPPVAQFAADLVSGTIPLTVTFADQSTGNVTAWSWNFGDGGTSTDQDPTHVYTCTGTYTVALTVSGPGGSDVETKVAYITVGYPAPVAAFSAAPLSGTAPLTVTFTDESTGPITAWDWTFGDGGVSGARHPTHIYETPETYAVSLTVTGPGGSDTETKLGYITVSPTGVPMAGINYIWPNPAIQGQDTIYFNGNGYDTDEDGAYITAYLWTSGRDGQLSVQEDFTIQAAELSVGAHTITFKCQDDEGVWSLPVTRTLTVQAGQPDVRTLILVNKQKLAALYSTSEADQVLTKLNALAAHTNVEGLVVQVESDSTVAAAYAARGSDYTNKNKANAVVEAIRQVILAQWSAHPDLEYLILVGDDRALPFYRTADGTWCPDTWTLTDDFYADSAPTPCQDCANPYLYIPDLASGRLVETPAQIIGQMDTFLADSGLNLMDATVTGYDFIQDGAQAHCGTLQSDDLTSDCTLIGNSWTRSDFISRVLQTHHDAISINGHASQYGFGTPSKEFISVSDFTGTAVDFSRAFFYTVGCHSGHNVPDALDLPEGLAIKKASYVANTGYGWGGGGVILSEELMWNLTKKLVFGAQTTPGQALMLAKQQYFADHPHPNEYDEKISTESTLYGLPMYQVTSPASLSKTISDESIRVQSQPVALEDDLIRESVSYSWPMPIPQTTPEGTYYTLFGAVVGQDGEPILPRLSVDVGRPGRMLHGVVFTGGSYSAVSTDPIVQRVFTTSVEFRPSAQGFTAPGWYPATFFAPNRVETGTGSKETLVATAGQYNPNLSSDRQRIYTSMNFDVYYHVSSSDWMAPAITSMSSSLEAGTTTITVGASDGDSGIHAVVIAYINGTGTWTNVSLTESGGKWSGSFPANIGTEFFIQAVDGAGNVTVDDNRGTYYQPGDYLQHELFLPLALKNAG